MWKEKLPANCPPSSAKELEVVVYRFLDEKEPKETDFLPYVSIYPDNERYKSLCEAYSISSFDSIDNAKSAWKRASERGKKLGSYVGNFSILKTTGQNVFKHETGHYSTWLYDSKENNTFECSNVIKLNESQS